MALFGVVPFSAEVVEKSMDAFMDAMIPVLELLQHGKIVPYMLNYGYENSD